MVVEREAGGLVGASSGPEGPWGLEGCEAGALQQGTFRGLGRLAGMSRGGTVFCFVAEGSLEMSATCFPDKGSSKVLAEGLTECFAEGFAEVSVEDYAEAGPPDLLYYPGPQSPMKQIITTAPITLSRRIPRRLRKFYRQPFA